MDCSFIVCVKVSDGRFSPVTSPVSCSKSDLDTIEDALLHAGFVIVKLPNLSTK